MKIPIVMIMEIDVKDNKDKVKNLNIILDSIRDWVICTFENITSTSVDFFRFKKSYTYEELENFMGKEKSDHPEFPIIMWSTEDYRKNREEKYGFKK